MQARSKERTSGECPQVRTEADPSITPTRRQAPERNVPPRQPPARGAEAPRAAGYRFARASTACSSTLTLGTASSFATFSASLWVIPFSQGQKMRAVGQTWVML